MPCGPGTYGRQKGRPKKRRGKKSTDIMYEMIGESIWDTYKNIACLLSEIQDPNDPGPHPAPFSGLSRKRLRGRTQKDIDEDPYKAPEQTTQGQGG